MTKEQVLQKANDYCNEKSYNETLTDDFKDKFSDFFARKYPDAAEDDEAAIIDLQFNLNTAFSAASKGITSKQKAFDDKEAEYKRQITELNKKIGQPTPPDELKFELPQDVKDQLAELEKFRKEETKRSNLKEILALAKGNIRSDLHKSFETFAESYETVANKTIKEQASSLVARFQAIFRDSLGDIKPLAPRQQQKRDEDLIASLSKVKVS